MSCPPGEALLSGYYLNELLLKLLARDDPIPCCLMCMLRPYVRVLASEHGEESCRRRCAFELLLLREIGLLPQLDMQTLTLEALQSGQDTASCLKVDCAWPMPMTVRRSRRALVCTAAALDDAARFAATLRASAAVTAELKPQLRQLLHYHCGVASLRTRQLLVDLQSF